MNKSFRKIAIATTAFTCATLFSFGWSQQHGASLSIDSAQARVGRPLTPVSVAGVARRTNRRAAYGYGAGVAAAAIGTAAVAASSPYAYERSGAYAPAAYYGESSAYADSYAASEPSGNARSGPYAASAYYGGGYYADSPWGAHECQPHHIFECHPYSEAWHY